MRKGQTHPAAKVSRELLAQGLLKLLETKDYSEITITQLCVESQVARRTFYRHFDSVEHVLEYEIEEVINKFKQHMQNTKSDDYRKIIITYFNFWSEYAHLLAMLAKNNLDYVIFVPYLNSLSKLPWLFPKGNLEKVGGEDYNCALAYHAGGLWSTLIYWITNRRMQNPARLAEIVCSIDRI